MFVSGVLLLRVANGLLNFIYMELKFAMVDGGEIVGVI